MWKHQSTATLYMQFGVCSNHGLFGFTNPSYDHNVNKSRAYVCTETGQRSCVVYDVSVSQTFLCNVSISSLFHNAQHTFVLIHFRSFSLDFDSIVSQFVLNRLVLQARQALCGGFSAALGQSVPRATGPTSLKNFCRTFGPTEISNNHCTPRIKIIVTNLIPVFRAYKFPCAYGPRLC